MLTNEYTLNSKKQTAFENPKARKLSTIKQGNFLDSKPESVRKRLNKLCYSIMQSAGDSGSLLAECGSVFAVNPRSDALTRNPEYLRAHRV